MAHDGAHHERPRGGLRGVRDSLGVVVRFARGNRTLAALLLSKTTFGVGTGVIVMLAIFGRDVFDAGDAGIGLLFAARGMGALIGPFLARSLVGLTDRGLLLGIAGSFVAWAVGYLLLPLAPLLWVAVDLRLRGAPRRRVAVDAVARYGLQRAAPDEIRGRVFSFDYGLVTVTIAISTADRRFPGGGAAAGDHDLDHGRAGRARGHWLAQPGASDDPGPAHALPAATIASRCCRPAAELRRFDRLAGCDRPVRCQANAAAAARPGRPTSIATWH